MSDLTIMVTSPFIVRHTLLIALEAVYPDLTQDQSARLRSFAYRLPKDITTREIRMDVDTLIDFAICMRRFRQTQTWYWLRDDLKKPILKFEHSLLRMHATPPIMGCSIRPVPENPDGGKRPS